MHLLRKEPLTLGFTVVLLISLPLLAGLQYNWLGQLSENEHERMKSNLQASAGRFTEEFDTELTRLTFAFSAVVSPVDRSTRDVDDLVADQYRNWVESAPHPRLVQALYLVSREEDDFGLRRFVHDTDEFVDAEWDGELDRILPHLRTYNRHRLGPGVQLALPPLSEHLVTDPMVLLLPQVEARRNHFRFDDREVHEVRIAEIVSSLEISSWLVIQLDRSYIRDEFIPELVERHFNSGGESRYRVELLRKDDPDTIFYASDPELLPAMLAEPDATSPIFNLSREVRFMWAFADSLSAGRTKAPTAQIVGRRGSDVKITTSLVDDMGVFAERLGETPHRLLSEPEWQLLAQHRAGSLEAAVNQIRQRNLMISFGILMVLGAGMMIIVMSTQRAQRLAQQQVDFVANVSHELRTPVAVISSAGENLEDGLISDPDKARQYGALIRAEARRLSRGWSSR